MQHTLIYPLLTAAAALSLFAASPAAAHGVKHDHQVAQGSSEVAIEAVKLNERLTLLSGVNGFTGGNVVVSNGDDGMLVIDDKIPQMTGKLIEELNKIGGMSSLKFVLNTHWHFDHAGGNAELGKTATIIAHANTRKRMSTEQKLDAFKMVLPPSPKSALPVITFDQSLSIHFNGEELKLIHFPASHTDTDAVVYFSKSKLLHTGDLFFNGMFPFVDVQNGGNVLNMTKSVAQLIEMYPEDVKIVPGHGPLASLKDLRDFHKMLVVTTANVVAMADAGKTLDEIKAAGVPKQYEKWSAIIDAATWNSLIYTSLKK
tara:strand:+ start:686 stop:1630 length:945 start_codon:yes stop_codon:yes gene_type:complete